MCFRRFLQIATNRASDDVNPRLGTSHGRLLSSLLLLLLLLSGYKAAGRCGPGVSIPACSLVVIAVGASVPVVAVLYRPVCRKIFLLMPRRS